MLKKRLIARMDIQGDKLIKTIRMEGRRKIGDPAWYAKVYADQGIDEIIYLDVVASLYGRNGLRDLVEKTTDDVFCPVTVGGGIRTEEDVRMMLLAGADKVCINTAAVKRPELINELSHKFGAQCIVLQLEVRGDEAYCDGGRQPTGKKAVEWAAEAVQRGAGEVFVTSIDREGTKTGCDLGLANAITKAVNVPVVISGGIGTISDTMDALEICDGVAMAGFLHFGGDIQGLKQSLSKELPIRL